MSSRILSEELYGRKIAPSKIELRQPVFLNILQSFFPVVILLEETKDRLTVVEL